MDEPAAGETIPAAVAMLLRLMVAQGLKPADVVKIPPAG
jgi:hypothetical protein